MVLYLICINFIDLDEKYATLGWILLILIIWLLGIKFGKDRHKNRDRKG